MAPVSTGVFLPGFWNWYKDLWPRDISRIILCTKLSLLMCRFNELATSTAAVEPVYVDFFQDAQKWRRNKKSYFFSSVLNGSWAFLSSKKRSRRSDKILNAVRTFVSGPRRMTGWVSPPFLSKTCWRYYRWSRFCIDEIVWLYSSPVLPYFLWKRAQCSMGNPRYFFIPILYLLFFPRRSLHWTVSLGLGLEWPFVTNSEKTSDISSMKNTSSPGQHNGA